MKRLGIVALVAAAFVPAAAALADGTPTGSWTATISGAPAARFNGVWTLTFARDGAYTVAENKQVLIRGHAKIKGATIAFNDESGRAACRGAQATGSYSWTATAKALRLRPLEDACTGRRFVLARRFAKSGS